jgi:RNA:NAD 2'-phosphotransferase (TPT1/KptA family)
VTERAASTVVALEIAGERVEVELDPETFARISAAVDAAKRRRSRAKARQLERIVARFLAANPEASANAVHRALGGRRAEVLRAVQALRGGVG